MNEPKKFRILYWAPMIWNCFTLFIMITVGLIFLVGSRLPADAEVTVPGIVRFIFTIFDILLFISPLTLIVTVLMSVFNVMGEGSKMQRFLPLVMSGIIQGVLTALLLGELTQPAA